MNALKAAMASAGREDEQERIADQLEGMLDELEAADVMRKRTAQEIRDELWAQGVRDPDLVDFDAADLNDDITDGLPFATEDDPHQQAEAEAADERALAAVFGQAVATQPDDSSTLVQNTRDTFQRNLDVCVGMKTRLEQDLGKAQRAYEDALATVEREFQADRSRILAELQRVTDVKESLDLAVARLNKSAG
jgi:hypothetical protein